MASDDPGDERTVRVLTPPASGGSAHGRRRRVRVVRRPDGFFGLVEEVALGSEEDWMTLWSPPTICDSEDAIVREACASLPWLRGSGEAVD